MKDPFLDYLEDVTAVIVSCRLVVLTFLYAGPSEILNSRRRCIDKLGVLHANQTSMCLDPHLN